MRNVIQHAPVVPARNRTADFCAISARDDGSGIIVFGVSQEKKKA